MTSAGELKFQFAFERRALDANDDPLGPWDTENVLQRRAALTYLTGGEGVQAARLQGLQPVLVVVRRDPETEAINNGFRVVDTLPGSPTLGRIFDIKTAQPSRDGAYIEVMAVWNGKDG